MRATPGAAVYARGLVKRYGPTAVVDHLDLDIRSGECFGFLGPNGAGKTTTMRMLSCLAHRDEGELSVLGRDPQREPRAVKAQLGVVAQALNLDLELTVRDNLLVYARYFDMPRAQAAERTDELLSFVQLTDRAGWTVDRLSGGMQRRVQIARALINDPRLVLLDEPTTGLDPQARRLVWDRLRALRARGVTLVLTTHDMHEAEALCDRLVVIDHGRVIREGAPGEMIRAEVGEEVVEFAVGAGAADGLAAALIPVCRAVSAREGALIGACDDAEAALAAARACGVAYELLAVRRATLEDVFLQLTGHELRDDT